MIAIHKSNNGFHLNWKNYCKQKNIPFKEVDCHSNDLIDQLKGCYALMWHHSQNNPTDLIIAKQILFSLQHSGYKVFPDFNSNWHFDDKLGQKYLLESLNIPFVNSYAFYTKETANEFISNCQFPIVFKLRGGAGSFNVKLIETKKEATAIVRKAFSNGFSNFNSINYFIEVYRKWRIKKAKFIDILKATFHLISKPKFSKILGRESGYVYFQEFIPNNSFDIRVIVIGNKAFAIKRNVRVNDFRASGSGFIEYDKSNFNNQIIKLSFDISKKIKTQCVAFDFVQKDTNPLLVEISYGFLKEGYLKCVGYWDEDLNFFEGSFDPCEWMVDLMVKNT
jgi:glutathione synthase/RimK-type ligase-like ATP-grasp enzyme